MTNTQDTPQGPPPSFFIDRLEEPLPKLSDSATSEELLSFMNETASHFWRCQIALNALFAMSPDEREATPHYLDLVNTARLGMAAARSLQELAAGRLERLSQLPEKWKAWPERRTEPRGPACG